MKIKIYQVNGDRDENRVKFIRFENLERWQGSSDIQSHIYDRVFDGDVDCKSLEGIYTLFNTERPVGHMGHSLSVGDIVQIELDGQGVERGFYYCDSYGFKKVDFEPQKAFVKEEKKMKVVMVEPEKEARIVDIGTGLEAMQQAVGGWIETMYPFEEEVAIVCNEEGKMTGLPLNRAIYMEGEMIDIIAGKFFICATPSDSDNFESLSDEQAAKYCEMFRDPERFYRVGDRITAMKVKRPLDEAIDEYKQSVTKPDKADKTIDHERDM